MTSVNTADLMNDIADPAPPARIRRFGAGFQDWEFDWSDVPVFTNKSGANPFADPFR